MGTDEHDHDSHYHGEPSRVLEDTAFPERIVLYGNDPREPFPEDPVSIPREDINYWQDTIQSIEHVQSILVPRENSPSDPEPHDLTLPREQIPFSTNFESFSEQLHETSVLLVPSSLRLGEQSWQDLNENDVTVNWLAIDPDHGVDSPGKTSVLSDWITSLGPDIPPVRSAGVLTGIIHFRVDDIPTVEEAFVNNNNLWNTIHSLINESNLKIRPGFLRKREWSYRD